MYFHQREHLVAAVAAQAPEVQPLYSDETPRPKCRKNTKLKRRDKAPDCESSDDDEHKTNSDHRERDEQRLQNWSISVHSC